MTSSCIPTGLRLDLDMVKAGAAHSSSAGAAYSSPSSTLSEASSSSSVSLKRARAPRKRPNQAYNEAAALLASIHPSVFPVKKSPKTAALAFVSGAGVGAAACSELLTPLPVLADAAFLLRDSPPPSTMPSPQGRPSDVRNCSSPAPVSSAFREFRDPAPSPASPEAGAADEEPGELDFDDDACFDAESILLDADEAAVDGIDGIMGSLTMEGGAGISDDSVLSSSGIHPYLRSLMVVGLAGRFELGLGSGSARHARPNLNRALKRRDDDDGGAAWWMWPAVPVKDITVAPTPPPQQPAAAPSNTATTMPAPAPEKKKSKKKKVVKLEKVMMANVKCEEEAADGGITVDARADGNGDDDGGAPTKAPKTGLGLKLDADDVLKEWAGKGSMFAEGGGPESTESAAEVRAKLADIDLFPENGAAGGIREASVMRYKEKRRNRLFSKKIRYQVRKVNADCRPRMKGRFVRSPSLLQQTLDEET